jgi:hypothetical protein
MLAILGSNLFANNPLELLHAAEASADQALGYDY